MPTALGSHPWSVLVFLADGEFVLHVKANDPNSSSIKLQVRRFDCNTHARGGDTKYTVLYGPVDQFCSFAVTRYAL